MRKLIKCLNHSEAHFFENYAQTRDAIKEAKQVLLDGTGTREEREELLEALLTFKWVEGGIDHRE